MVAILSRAEFVNNRSLSPWKRWWNLFCTYMSILILIDLKGIADTPKHVYIVLSSNANEVVVKDQ